MAALIEAYQVFTWTTASVRTLVGADHFECRACAREQPLGLALEVLGPHISGARTEYVLEQGFQGVPHLFLGDGPNLHHNIGDGEPGADEAD